MEAIKYFYNPFCDSEINEQQQFIEILHHDYRGGFIKRTKLNGSEVINYATKEYHTIECYDEKFNTYVTLNSFSKPSKNAKYVHSINCIYFDLDCHSWNQNYIDSCIDNTAAILKREFETEEIPAPTMITSTGRGLGLFYVLKRSIANTVNTKKSIRYWEVIYKLLYKKIKSILDLYEDVLNIDPTSVADKSRIVRMPLTKNQNNGRMCTIKHIYKEKSGKIKYYDLSELGQYVKEEQLEIPTKQKNSKNVKVVSFNAYKLPFLSARMKKLELLQANFNAACTNRRRELMCFFYFNCAKQLNPKTAADVLYIFNEGFQHPLELSELDHVMDSVNSNKPKFGGYEGYYRITDKYIMEKLELSEEEKVICGFGISKKSLQREKIKQANKEKKAARNKQIVEMIISHPELTYDEIADQIKVSVRTIKNVASKAGIRRYGNTVSEKSCQKAKRNVKDDVIIVEKCKKMPESLNSGVYYLDKEDLLSQNTEIKENNYLKEECENVTDQRDVNSIKTNLKKDLVLDIELDGQVNFVKIVDRNISIDKRRQWYLECSCNY